LKDEIENKKKINKNAKEKKIKKNKDQNEKKNI
jgi:hypothetical protein